MKRRACAGVLAAMWIGCSGPRPIEPPRADGCAAVAAEGDALLAAGRIERAAEALGRASARCAEPPASLLATRGALLAELGDAAGAEAIAARLGGSPDAASQQAMMGVRAAIARFSPRIPEGAARAAALDEIDRAAEAHHAKDYVRAYEGHARAWEAWHPLAKASAGAGLAAQALGRRPEARRLFDRALAEARDRFSPGIAVPPRDALPQAVSPDGELLAVVALRSVLVFSRANRRLVIALDPAPNGPDPAGVSFDARGGRIASLEGDTLAIHHALSGRRLASHRLEPRHDVGPAREVTAFSPDGRRVAFVSRGVGVVDLDTGSLRYLARDARFDLPAALAWSSDGGRLAVGHRGGVETWDARTLRRSRADRVEGQVVSLRFGDRTLDVAAVEGATFFTRRDAATGAVMKRLTASGDVTYAAEISADGERVARISSDQGLAVWSIASGERRVISRSPAWDGHGGLGPPRAARVLFPRGDEVLARCGGRGVCAFDAGARAGAAAAPRVIVGALDAPRWAVTRSANGNAIVEVDSDDRVRIWDLAAGALRVIPLVTGCEGRRDPEPLVRIADMSADGASFRVIGCGREQTVHAPELAGKRGTGRVEFRDVAGVEGANAGIVRRGEAFDFVGPDADAGATQAWLVCGAKGIFPLEVCEDRLRVPGLLRDGGGAPPSP